MSEPQQVTEEKQAVGGRNDEPKEASAMDVPGAELLNPVGGGLAEPAADLKPGEGQIQDMPGGAEHLDKLSGDVGTVKGPGLGSVQGGIDERGGSQPSATVASQSDTAKLEGSEAAASGGGGGQQA